ncbi:MAG TPA: hypothetical protein PKI19_03185 [Elusimicrobiales bacterium]|nr:hypothetical protein [Elusimicrobiales bacterium]
MFERFIRRASSAGAALRAAALLLYFSGGLAAQNLYISKMDTWYRQGSNGGNGYCSDVDSSITVDIVNGGPTGGPAGTPVSGLFTGTDSSWAADSIIAGTRYLDSLGTDSGDGRAGPCTTASEGAFNATNVNGTYSGQLNGTLHGFEGFANGLITGTVTGEPRGDLAVLGTDSMHCVPTAAGPSDEDFEDGNFTGTGVHWATQGHHGWVTDNTTSHNGTWSARSGDIDDSEYSVLTVGFYVMTAGPVTFYYKTDSEASYDFLRLYVDNSSARSLNASGLGGAWTYGATGNLAVGFHYLRWVYTKDGSNSPGSDSVWIDDVHFPPHTELYNGTAVPSGALIQTTVYGTTDANGFIAAQVDTGTVTGPLTCTAGPPACTPGSRRWRSSVPSADRAFGSVTGSVKGTAVFVDTKVSFYSDLTGNTWNDSARIEYERPKNKYPGSCLGLCASIMCVVGSTPTAFGIDDLTFDIFKFGPGANPLDPASTPPVKTISLYNIGTCDSGKSYPPHTFGASIPVGTFCAAWDGTYNLNGMFGKTNGQFGYRAKVTTRQTTPNGTSIDIEQTAAYPGQTQIPIQVDVTNLHMGQSVPTAVGNLTKVPGQPYNLKYRLSKDATASITIWDTDVSHQTGGAMTLVRTIISSQPRVGEGIPDGVLTNGDWWDGRNDAGVMVPAGSYIVRIDAGSNDDWSIAPFNEGEDLAWPTTIQMVLDPLQVTDVGIRPLGASATDMATISYLLTEAATAYVEIYTPGTQFYDTNVSPPVKVPGTGTLLRSFVEEEGARQAVNVYWDGRDSNGAPVCDGDYVYAIYAEMPSTGTIGNFSWNSIKTRRTMVGTIPVSRGKVLAFISAASTLMGTSSPAAGLDPFYFRYTPVRNAAVSVNIKNMDGSSATTVRSLVANEERFSNIINTEIWDGKRDDGTFVSSGNYLAELIATDPYQCAVEKVSTTTVLFPVHMFRILEARSSSLLGGASAYATVSFEMSQSMYIDLKIYPVTVTVDPQNWPPNLGDTVFRVQGVRPGRMRITEPWDGLDASGNVVPDGRYPYTLEAYSTGPAQVMYATDKVYGYVDVSRGQVLFSGFEVYPNIPTMYNGGEVVNLPPYGIEYSVTRQSSVTVQIVTLDQAQNVVADVVKGEVRDGETLYKDFWDGKCTNTQTCPTLDYVPGGAYTVRVTAQDLGADLKQQTTVQQTIDVFPLRIFDLSIAPLTLGGQAVISYQISEPMKVVTKIYKPGTNPPGLTNDPPNSLVKLIVGVRPARTQISEYWDGTDLTLSQVTDGNYVFKIYGTTVTGGINSANGYVTPGTLLADDVIVNNVPVIKSGTADLCGDFARETFFAPNPYRGQAGWFKIPALMNGKIGMHIYNLVGDMVYEKDFGLRGGGNNVDGSGQCSTTHTHPACWPKVNSSGRTVSPGVYLAVIRFEATEGTRDVCQVVKKILIP